MSKEGSQHEIFPNTFGKKGGIPTKLLKIARFRMIQRITVSMFYKLTKGLIRIEDTTNI